MAKYTVTYRCGHEREVTLFGPTRDRERKLEWMATIRCPECQKKAEGEAIQKREEELGLPALQGSEKQVNWAKDIRISRINSLERWGDQINDKLEDIGYRIEEAEKKEMPEKAEKYKNKIAEGQKLLEEVIEAMEGIHDIDKASWWIDIRDKEGRELLEAYKAYKGIQMEKAIEEETKPAMIVMEPEEKKTSTVATVKAYDKEVTIQSDRDEHIRLTIKKHGFTWDGSRTAWTKPVTEMTGPAKDLGPDTARILLEAGIPVKAYPDIMQAVESGSYEQETKRWIMRSSKDRDKLFIAKVEGVKLPDGCKTTYNGDGIISPTLWREIREFASLNGYRITRLADEMLQKAEAATVSVKLPDGGTVQASADDALKAILESSRDVLDDLKEED